MCEANQFVVTISMPWEILKAVVLDMIKWIESRKALLHDKKLNRCYIM